MHGLGVRRASTAPTSLISSRSADAAEAKNRTTDRCGYPCMGSTCLQPFAAWKVPLTCRPVLEAMRIPDRSCGFYFRCLIAEAASHIIKAGHVPPISVPWRAWVVSASPKTSAWRRIRYEEVQGRCQAMLLCLRGVIGLGHGVNRLPATIKDIALLQSDHHRGSRCGRCTAASSSAREASTLW
jgi:hypothetical protein